MLRKLKILSSLLFFICAGLMMGVGCNNHQASVLGGNDDGGFEPDDPFEGSGVVVDPITGCTLSFSSTSVSTTSISGVVQPVSVHLNVAINGGEAKVTGLIDLNGKDFDESNDIPSTSEASHILEISLKQAGTYNFKITVKDTQVTKICTKAITVNVAATATPSVTFYTEHFLTAEEIPYNGHIVIAWLGTNVNSCQIYKDNIALTNLSTATIGLFDTNPLQNPSNLYDVRCTSPSGLVTKSVGISVRPLPNPVLNASWPGQPSQLAAGGKVSLSWNVANVVSCIVYQGSTALNSPSAAGNLDVTLNAAASFKLSCKDTLPNTVESAVVSVPVAAPLPVMNISASPNSVAYDGSTTVTWSASNVTTCWVTRTLTNGTGQIKIADGSSGTISQNNLKAGSKFWLYCDDLWISADVSVGDPVDHIMFATSSTYQGNLIPSDTAEATAITGTTGLDRADAICNYRAKYFSVRPDRIWKALMSNSTMDIKNRIRLVGPVYGTNGNRIDKTAGLWAAGSIKSGIANESGGDMPDDAWTGSTTAGLKDSSTCSGWTTASSSKEGRVGDGDDLDSEWIKDSSEDCNKYEHLFCISQ